MKRIFVVKEKCTACLNCVVACQKFHAGSDLYAPIRDIEPGHRVSLYYLNTLDDGKRIINAAAKAREAVIIGAGFRGLEVAFNLRKRGLKVTLVDKAVRILPAQLDKTAAKIIAYALEAEGIRVCLGAGVTEVVPNRGFLRRSGIKGVILENGDSIGSD